MKKTTILLSCLAMLMLSSCDSTKDDAASAMVKSAKADTDMTQVKAEIQAIENRWAEALTKKDISALMTLYTDDAMSMQDGAPTLNGKAAIQAQQLENFTSNRYTSIAFQTQDVFGSADEVTEVGTSLETDASGKTSTGKYMAVFKKVDGIYKCVREIYNSDAK